MDKLFEFLNNQSGLRLFFYGIIFLITVFILSIAFNNIFRSISNIFKTKAVRNKNMGLFENKVPAKIEEDWISVNDALPEEGHDQRSEMVETKLVDGSIMAGYRFRGGWCDRLGYAELGFPDCRVAFWRPYPKNEDK